MCDKWRILIGWFVDQPFCSAAGKSESENQMFPNVGVYVEDYIFFKKPLCLKVQNIIKSSSKRKCHIIALVFTHELFCSFAFKRMKLKAS